MYKTIALAAGILSSASYAQAGTVGFDLNIVADPNVPTFTLTNTSTTALLETFSITIGEVSLNFDFIDNVTDPTGGATTVTIGDSVNSGTRFDMLALEFTDFDGGESMSFRVDIDEDNSNTRSSYKTTLFNNASGVNSVLTATFSDDSLLAFTIPNQAEGNLKTYTFSASQQMTALQEAAPVPLPAGLPMLVAGMGAFAMVRRAKKAAA